MPEDARFCHKCGKPQFEEDLARIDEEAAQKNPVQRPLDVPGETAPASVGLTNFRAITITLAVAALALIPLAASMVFFPLGLLVLCGAGYASASFYRKQTLQPITTGGGAYLGAMTGVWLFLAFAFCVLIVSFELNSATGREILKSGMARMPEIAKILDDPHQFLIGLRQALIGMFFYTTISGALGGILSARRHASRPHPQGRV